MVKNIVLAVGIAALLATASPASALTCGSNQEKIKIRDGSVIGGETCADFGGDFWSNIWFFWFN